MARGGWTLRELYALAWLDELERRTPMPTGPETRLRLDDTGRPPYVPLRPDDGDCAWCGGPFIDGGAHYHRCDRG